jgi:hypothetical protein
MAGGSFSPQRCQQKKPPDSVAFLLRQINDDRKGTLQQFGFSLQSRWNPSYVKSLLSSLLPESRCKVVPK